MKIKFGFKSYIIVFSEYFWCLGGFGVELDLVEIFLVFFEFGGVDWVFDS